MSARRYLVHLCIQIVMQATTSIGSGGVYYCFLVHFPEVAQLGRKVVVQVAKKPPPPLAGNMVHLDERNAWPRCAWYIKGLGRSALASSS
jgi:hypothetical protein